MGGQTLRAAVVSAVPVAALLALGGAYAASTLPLLAAAACAFLVSGARVAAPETRVLDAALIAIVAVVLLQVVPLPPAAVAALSPQAPVLQDALTLQPAGSRALSIDARRTREGLATLASALLLFWAARHAVTGGGLRLFARLVACSGGLVALLALIGRATAPGLLLWRWKPIDPGAQPFGPFVNRNHFATWLLMAAALTAGYLVAHLRARRIDEQYSPRLIARDLLADGWTMLVAGALGIMLLALVASLSRAALLGLAAAVTFALIAARQKATSGRALTLAGATVAVLVAAALWINRDGLLRRVDATLDGEAGRPAIWKATLPIVADFPATGTGVGTFGSAMLRYQRTRPETLFNHAHNEYLQVVAEGGLLLAIAVGAALLCWIRAARRQRLDEGDAAGWIRLGAAAGLCGVAVQGLFEAGLRMPANALLGAALAAIVVSPRAAASAPRRCAFDQPPRHAHAHAVGVAPGQ